MPIIEHSTKKIINIQICNKYCSDCEKLLGEDEEHNEH